MIKKAVILLLMLMTVGCASFEKEVAKELVATHKAKLDRCEIEGFSYKGIDENLNKNKVLKVLMIHGVGTHFPGYSRRIQENLANNIGLDVRSRVPKNITLLDPKDHKTQIGNLQITFWQNKDKSKNMLFYELTWSEITIPDKQIIAFDTREEYSKFRVPFNEMMKKFLDNTLPDPLIYLVDKNNLILDSSNQAVCWMLKTNWSNIPNGKAEVCDVSMYNGIKDFDNENLLFITHSLGSKILMDSLIETSDNVSATAQTTQTDNAQRQLIKSLQNREITVFMLANQLPILQIGHPLPKVHNQINSYCSTNGKNYQNRIFKGVNIVAFSDPNDILSYAIPQEFVDTYIDSRICPKVTNVSVNVAPEISAFGVGIVNPVSAHTDYDNSPKVINLITHGTYGFYEDNALKEQCHFVLMKNDNKMK